MPVMMRADVATAHNYSAQSLNSTEIAKEKLRQELIKVMIFPTNKATIDFRRQFNAQSSCFSIHIFFCMNNFRI